VRLFHTVRLLDTPEYTEIPYRVEQGACRELPVLKTGSMQGEQDPCNENRFSLGLKHVFPVRMWASEIPVFITCTRFALYIQLYIQVIELYLLYS
jgi:hypothetical protein